MIALTEQTGMGFRGYVLYDAECALCTGLARQFRRMLETRDFVLLPLQTPWVRELLGVAPGELFDEMKLMEPDGTMYGGAEGMLRIARTIWWASPLWWIAAIPGMRRLFDRMYRWVARNRHCIGGSCRLPSYQS